MTPPDAPSLTDILHTASVILPLIQSLVVVVLGYISKLLRDIRKELHSMDRRLTSTEVTLAAERERLGAVSEETQRKIDTLSQISRRDSEHLTRRIERVEALHYSSPQSTRGSTS